MSITQHSLRCVWAQRSAVKKNEQALESFMGANTTFYMRLNWHQTATAMVWRYDACIKWVNCFQSLLSSGLQASHNAAYTNASSTRNNRIAWAMNSKITSLSRARHLHSPTVVTVAALGSFLNKTWTVCRSLSENNQYFMCHTQTDRERECVRLRERETPRHRKTTGTPLWSKQKRKQLLE